LLVSTSKTKAFNLLKVGRAKALVRGNVANCARTRVAFVILTMYTHRSVMEKDLSAATMLLGYSSSMF
jgi:hypothetical protein